MTAAQAPGVLVTVGTDHHPFDRLMTWIEQWPADAPEVRWTVQHGSTRAPAAPGVRAAAMMPHDELLAALAEAAVVVCQGGPGSVMDARGAGKVPIVVPRRPELGEHVDDHQVLFARRLEGAGLIRIAAGAGEFRELVTAALRDPGAFAARDGAGDLPGTVARFDSLVGELMSRPARRPLLPLPRRARRESAR
ncbi:glycosyltransferase [Streptomyces sp. DSM 44917]|uniref:Glycosyltransferase n=1 Tax=Streptomyces boetiae TaxID=3075541 RepID=A0ABU2L5P6_9ACTN|nr:glycosyltransferase [Streptomyces sp. DSM 44917]MDT0306761.1 glycosyltransferase [Streptomyces sp. DSM 44917]